jgi:hypothetical protein
MLNTSKHGSSLLLSLLFACSQHFFYNAFGNMPLIKEMLNCWVRFSYSLCDPTVPIGYKYWDCQASNSQQEIKATLCPLQFHCITVTSLICLQHAEF